MIDRIGVFNMNQEGSVNRGSNMLLNLGKSIDYSDVFVRLVSECHRQEFVLLAFDLGKISKRGGSQVYHYRSRL